MNNENGQQVTDETPGTKFDDCKIRYDLMSMHALQGYAGILTHGDIKYTARNWEKGMQWGRMYGALMRHLSAFWAGEDIDEDSGHPHLDCVIFAAACLKHWQAEGTATDDRVKLKNFVSDRQTLMQLLKDFSEEIAEQKRRESERGTVPTV